MLKPIENAEKLYNSFINKQSEKDFFIGFSDYFSYLDKHQELLACFVPELEKGNELNETLKSSEIKAIEEFKETLEKVKKDTKKNKLDTQPYVMELYKDIDGIFEGKIASSAPLLNNVYNNLVDIVSVLVKEGKLDDVRKYAKLYERNNPVLLDRVNAPKLQEWTEVESYRKQQEQLSIWGLFYRVRNLYNMFSQCEVEFKRLAKKENATSQDRLTWLFLASSVNEYMNLIHANGKEIQNRYFLKQKHIGDIERFHNFLTINYREQVEALLEQKEENDFVYFDENKSLLVFEDCNFTVKKFSNIYHILKHLFLKDNFYEESFYDEINEHLDSSKINDNGKMYDALYQFRERLSKKNKQDFLILSTQSVVLDTKYKKRG